MKYIILIGDGMADLPVPELDGRTPLQVARTPFMDSLAARGEGGLVRTVPPGMPPGSAVANLSILGYDPRKVFSGRAPLEAASMGIMLSPHEVAYRCNLITQAQGRVQDYSAGHITTAEARELIQLVNRRLGTESITFYPGVSYRHLLVIKNRDQAAQTYPPHDIIGQLVDTHLPVGVGASQLRDLMEASRPILAETEINQARTANGKNPANMIWLWGGGRAVPFPTLNQQFGIQGAIISAVDLVKGIGILAGCKVVNVPGATGYLDTNYQGKAVYALQALETVDLVYVHVEAPDEASHSGSLPDKIKAIEDFDRLVVGTVCEGIKSMGKYTIMVMPDHPTPLSIKTHSGDPVPFAVFRSHKPGNGRMHVFSEAAAAATGTKIEIGHSLLPSLLTH